MSMLVFATNNQNKVEEIQASIGKNIRIISLKEAGIVKDIPEPYNTLEQNATAKSKTIFELTGRNCFSEDTGLEVEALGGAPGVKSARYAGEEKSFENNIKKLLEALDAHASRTARFRTVISLIWEGKEHYFEGICNGTILMEKRGKYGFGYDPVFMPDGADKTFAEMNLQEKNVFSHRRKAADKLVLFLQDLINS